MVESGTPSSAFAEGLTPTFLTGDLTALSGALVGALDLGLVF
jgi:hypothetical protein